MLADVSKSGRGRQHGIASMRLHIVEPKRYYTMLRDRSCLALDGSVRLAYDYRTLHNGSVRIKRRYVAHLRHKDLAVLGEYLQGIVALPRSVPTLGMHGDKQTTLCCHAAMRPSKNNEQSAT